MRQDKVTKDKEVKDSTPRVNCLPQDPSSYSRPEYATTKHFHLDWKIDFNEKTISGSILLHMCIKDFTVNQIVLDTKRLTIRDIFCEKSGESLNFDVGKHDCIFGSQLTIFLPPGIISKEMLIRILYTTSPFAPGLHWLSRIETVGKTSPFLFSQCQPIHARSMMPCQDTPQVKATYSAVVKCDSHLIALMSALREETIELDDKTTAYKFRQPVAIPSYLTAIVVGDLVCEDIGPRSKVWSEKNLVKNAACQCANTEKILKMAESFCGEYVWGQCDILILPHSLPCGGMENPCLTFITPTLLTEGQSLRIVIAHELCHSWTGNLVTSCNWENFWLNEGFTVFIERKMQEKMYGKRTRHSSSLEGWKQLIYYVESRGNSDPMTCLCPKLQNVNPDDALNSVPYEKGHTLLCYLEMLVGGPEKFEPFLKAYLKEFQHQSIDTSTFREFFVDYFAIESTEIEDVDWDTWFNVPGMPPFQPKFELSPEIFKDTGIKDKKQQQILAKNLPKLSHNQFELPPPCA